ncbi:type II secretion system F family protein [Thiorhodospira sibirica]|uniref:type II secretion system F family protein n=1 Tax=Thiorhodospira sibirica TaxID=154347 RepID=UPI00022C1173|nr:type II secretion system F family protein [Thiorhodospira sibirica]
MAHFSYRAKTSDGRTLNGELNADSAEAAAEQLDANNLIPLQIERLSRAQHPSGNASLAALLPKPKVTLNDLILFSRQMYSVTKAGIPLIQGLERLAESTPNPTLAGVLRDISRDLESGRDVTSSFARHPKVFNSLYISLLRVGEMTGQLEKSFESMHNYLSRDRDTINKIKTATRYPLFVVVAIGIAIAILTIVVIPAFAQLFSSANMELPLPTRIILGVSAFAVQWWQHILVGLIAAGFAFKYWTNTASGRLRWDRSILSIPRIGNILLRATLARFTRAFGIALKAGVPITQALAGVAPTTGNTFITQKINTMQTGIERGESVLRTAAATGAFTPIILQMIAVGEETGQLDDMMMEVADFYDREVAYDIDNLSSIIEPILTVAVGIMVLILALGVFLPMWDMTQLASR